MTVPNALPRYINPKMTVTIDGWAGSGKGTLARRLAEYFRLKYLDTGTLYRSTAYLLKQNGYAPDDADAAVKLIQGWDFDFRHVGDNKFGTFLNGENVSVKIRTAEMGRLSNIIATCDPKVREVLRDFQVDFAKLWESRTGVVLDGRDIGGKICPNAQVKIFMDADPEIRARRRYAELIAAGENIDFATVLADVNKRDERDAVNTKPAPDAIHLDSTKLTIPEVFEKAVHLIISVIEAQHIEYKSDAGGQADPL